MKRLRINLAMLLGSTGVATLLGFCTIAINARFVGAEGVGVIALFQSSAALLVGVFSFGTQQPLIKFGRQAIEDGQNADVGVIFLFCFAIDSVAALVAGLVGLLLIYFYAENFGLPQEYIGLAKQYLLVIFFSGVAAANGVFRLLNRFYLVGAFQVLLAMLLLASSCILAFISAPMSWYVSAYAFIYALCGLLQVISAFWITSRSDVGFSSKFQVLGRSGFMRDFFSYVWTTNVTGTINTLRANLDVLLLGYFFGPAISGIYSVARQLAGVMNKITGVISVVVFPEVSMLAAKRNYVGAFKLLRNLAVGGLLLGAVAIVLAATLGEYVLLVGFGEQFVRGSIALNFLVLASAIMVSAAAFGGFVQVLISPRALLNIYAVAFVTYTLVLVPAVYFFGLDGIAAGQLVFSLVVWFGCWVPLFYRLQGLQKHVDLHKRIDVASLKNEVLNDER